MSRQNRMKGVIRMNIINNPTINFTNMQIPILIYGIEQGKKGIWLKLSEEQAELVPVAIKVYMPLSLSLEFDND